jgi:hypothetical protein
MVRYLPLQVSADPRQSWLSTGGCSERVDGHHYVACETGGLAAMRAVDLGHP